MENSTITPLTGDLLLITQLDLVVPTTVGGTLYGVAFTLFCLYLHALVPRLQSGDRKRQAKLMIAYSTVIMLCGLYSIVYNAWITQDAYIKHSSYPLGPVAYMDSTDSATSVTSIGFTCQVIIDILTSAIQIWRVWVIWSPTQYAILAAILPALSFLTFTGLELRTLLLQLTLPSVEAAEQNSKTQPAGIAIQVATTILCTLLISSYLTFKQWQQRRLIGKNQGFTGYMNVVAMIVESYALESVWLLGIVVFWNGSTQVFFAESQQYIETIAYLLVQYRVAKGQSYESQGGRKNMSSLRWNHSNHARTQLEEASEIQGSPHVSIIPAAPKVIEISNMA